MLCFVGGRKTPSAARRRRPTKLRHGCDGVSFWRFRVESHSVQFAGDGVEDFVAAEGGGVGFGEEAVVTEGGEGSFPRIFTVREEREAGDDLIGMEAVGEAELGEGAFQGVFFRSEDELFAVGLASRQAETRGGAAAEAEVVAAVPGVEVVAAAEAGFGVVGGLVPFQAGGGEPGGRLFNRIADAVGVGRFQTFAVPPAAGVDGEAVH